MKYLPAKIMIVAVGALTASLVIGCGSDEEEEVGPKAGPSPTAGSSGAGTAEASKPVVTADARKEAEQIFTSRCITCHGPQGKGDGPGAAKLDPKPRNYHDKKWQESVTDEQIEKTIVYGGAAVGKSAQMVPNPDLGNKPAVVAALREKVREFGKQPESVSETPKGESPAAVEKK